MKNEIKRKHHYVWAYYLKAWSKNNNIYYMSKKGNVAFDSVYGLSCEKDFYKVSFFSDADLYIARYFANLSQEILRKLHNNLIDNIYTIQCLFNISFNIKTNTSNELKMLENEKNKLLHNFLEDYHSDIERRNLDVLNILRTGDCSILDDKETRWFFYYYLGFQNARTKKYKDLILWSASTIEGDASLTSLLQNFIKKHWWFMCFYFGTNFAGGISLNPQYKLLLLNNCTNEPFITSDQPIININPLGHLSDNVDYYYPISEKYSLLIFLSENIGITSDIYDEEIIKDLNMKICQDAGDTIYSTSADIIEKYRVHFNTRKFKTLINSDKDNKKKSKL